MDITKPADDFLLRLRRRLTDDSVHYAAIKSITILTRSPLRPLVDQEQALRQMRHLLLGNDDMWIALVGMLHPEVQQLAYSLYPTQRPASYIASNIIQSFRAPHQERSPASPSFSAEALLHRIQDEKPEILPELLAALKSYQMNPIFTHLVQTASRLFEDRPDLLMNFAYFAGSYNQKHALVSLSRQIAAAQATGYALAVRKQLKRKPHSLFPSTPSIRQSLPESKRPRNLSSTASTDSTFATLPNQNKKEHGSEIFPPSPRKTPSIMGSQKRTLATSTQQDALQMNYNRRHSSHKKLRLPTRRATEKNNLFSQDFDLNALNQEQCERVFVSYIKLPSYARRFVTSGVDDLGRSVLNSEMIAPTADKYDQGRANPNAEISFIVEQDQMELDMLLCRAQATVKKCLVMRSLVKNPRFDVDNFDVENLFSAIDKVTIRKVFGRTAHEKLEMLSSTPESAVDDVIAGLETKIGEYVEKKNYWNKIWRAKLRETKVLSLNDNGDSYKTQRRLSYSHIALLKELRGARFNRKRKGETGPDLSFQLPSRYIRRLVLSLLSRVATASVGGAKQQPLIDAINTIADNLNDDDTLLNETKKKSMLFNHPCYVIYRYFTLIGECLQRAEDTKDFDSTILHFPTSLRPLPVSTTHSFFASHDELLSSQPLTPKRRAMVESEVPPVEEKMEHLLDLVMQRVLGEIDIPLYEERVLKLFGKDSYFLFDLDYYAREVLRLIQLALVPGSFPQRYLNEFSVFHKNHQSYRRIILRLFEEEKSAWVQVGVLPKPALIMAEWKGEKVGLSLLEPSGI